MIKMIEKGFLRKQPYKPLFFPTRFVCKHSKAFKSIQKAPQAVCLFTQKIGSLSDKSKQTVGLKSIKAKRFL